MSFPRWLLRNQIVELRGNERSTCGKKIPKKSCMLLQGSGGDSGSWTEGAFGDVLRGKYFGGFRGLERRILRYFEVVLFGCWREIFSEREEKFC